MATVIATDRWVGACFGHEPGVSSRPRPQGDQAVRERHDWTMARHMTILPPTSDSLSQVAVPTFRQPKMPALPLTAGNAGSTVSGERVSRRFSRSFEPGL